MDLSDPLNKIKAVMEISTLEVLVAMTRAGRRVDQAKVLTKQIRFLIFSPGF